MRAVDASRSTRLMKKKVALIKLKQCICCSGKAFEQCCEPLLLKKLIAKTPLQLMRSRYSAFALGGFGEYLLSTWAVAGAMGLSAPELSISTVDWQGLSIIGHEQTGDLAHVEFEATFLDANKTPQTHHEYSRFERVKNHWLYTNGDVRN